MAGWDQGTRHTSIDVRQLAEDEPHRHSSDKKMNHVRTALDA